MARGPIPYLVLKTNGDATPGASAQINLRGGGAATIFSGETGGSTLSNPQTTDSEGRIAGWLDEGSYDITISGAGITTVARGVEILRGSGSFAEADGSITTAKIVDGAVTNPKLAANSVDGSKIQDASVADTDLASPTSGVWRTVSCFQANNSATGPLSTSTYFFAIASGGALSVLSGGSCQGIEGHFVPSADYDISGKTTKMRLKVIWLTNATAAGTNIIWGMYPVNSVGGGSGSISPTLGSVIAGTTCTAISPGATASGVATGTEFNMSALTGGLGVYLPGVTTAGAFNAACTLGFQVMLEIRHV